MSEAASLRFDPAALETLFAALDSGGFKLGQAGRSRALALITELVADDALPTGADGLADWLMPIIVTSGADRATFRDILARWAAGAGRLKEAPPPPPEPKPDWRAEAEVRTAAPPPAPRPTLWARLRPHAGLIAAAFALVAGLGGLHASGAARAMQAWMTAAFSAPVPISGPSGPQPQKPVAPAPPEAAPRAADSAPDAPAARIAFLGEALRAKAAPYGYAPTIDELTTDDLSLPAEAPGALALDPRTLAARLGLDLDTPLPLHRADMAERVLRAMGANELTSTPAPQRSPIERPGIGPREGSRQSQRALTDTAERRLRDEVDRIPLTALAQFSVTLEISPETAQVTSRLPSRPITVEDLARSTRTAFPQIDPTLTDADIARAWALYGWASGQPIRIKDPPWRAAPPPQSAPQKLADEALWRLPMLAAGLIALTAIALWLAAALNARAFIARRKPDDPGAIADLAAQDRARAERAEPGLRLAARRMLERAGGVEQLDLPATVDATSRAAGFFTPIARAMRRQPEYLFLIDARSRADHDARRALAYVERLRAENVKVDAFFFDRAPDRVREGPTAPLAPLDTIMSTHAGKRLIIVGDAAAMLEEDGKSVGPWGETIAAWEDRAVLTTVPAEEWGREEATLAAALGVLVRPLSTPALIALPGDLRGETRIAVADAHDIAGAALPAHLRTAPHRWLSDDPPDDDTVARTLSELKAYLGASGYRWLCACAVYPAIDWDLTQALGWRLTDPAGAAVVNEARTALISELPWMRAGAMPDWLRGRLINDMAAEDRQAVRAFIAELMDAARSGVRRRPDEIGLRISVEGGRDAFDDEVFVSFLIGDRDQRDLKTLDATRKVRELLLPPLLVRLARPRELGVLLGGLALALGAFVFAPRLDGGPAATGAFAALIALIAAPAAVWFGVRRFWPWARDFASRAREWPVDLIRPPEPMRFGLAQLLARTWMLWTLAAASAVLTAAFAIFGPQTGGPLLDMIIDPVQVRERLAMMSGAQLNSHALITFVLDGLYPLAYGGLFAGVIWRFGGRAWGWAAALVAVVVVVDYFENALQLLLLSNASPGMDLVGIKALATAVKFALSFALMGIVAVASIAAIERSRRGIVAAAALTPTREEVLRTVAARMGRRAVYAWATLGGILAVLMVLVGLGAAALLLRVPDTPLINLWRDTIGDAATGWRLAGVALVAFAAWAGFCWLGAWVGRRLAAWAIQDDAPPAPIWPAALTGWAMSGALLCVCAAAAFVAVVNGVQGMGGTGPGLQWPPPIVLGGGLVLLVHLLSSATFALLLARRVMRSARRLAIGLAERAKGVEAVFLDSGTARDRLIKRALTTHGVRYSSVQNSGLIDVNLVRATAKAPRLVHDRDIADSTILFEIVAAGVLLVSTSQLSDAQLFDPMHPALVGFMRQNAEALGRPPRKDAQINLQRKLDLSKTYPPGRSGYGETVRK